MENTMNRDAEIRLDLRIDEIEGALRENGIGRYGFAGGLGERIAGLETLLYRLVETLGYEVVGGPSLRKKDES
jgi:hypothetical protein